MGPQWWDHGAREKNHEEGDMLQESRMDMFPEVSADPILYGAIRTRIRVHWTEPMIRVVNARDCLDDTVIMSCFRPRSQERPRPP